MVKKYPEDQTEMSLIFGNITEDDILLREEIERVRSCCDAMRPTWQI